MVVLNRGYATAEDLTEDLFRWSHGMARRFIKTHGDCAGRFEACIGTALYRAMRTFDPEVNGEFPKFAKHVVKQVMMQELAESPELGYRRNSHNPDRPGESPKVSHGSALAGTDDIFQVAGFNPPIGWELEYEDFVNVLADDLPEDRSRVLRMTYLDCRGAKVRGAASVLGISHPWYSRLHADSIMRIRKRLGVSNA